MNCKRFRAGVPKLMFLVGQDHGVITGGYGALRSRFINEDAGPGQNVIEVLPGVGMVGGESRRAQR